MTYRYAVSYESDKKPVQTVRGLVDANALQEAVRRANFRAEPPKGPFRSVVVVVEELVAPGLKTC